MTSSKKSTLLFKVKKTFWRYTSLTPIELEKEFAPYRKYCRGVILNVGSGARQLDLGPGHLKTDIGPSFPVDFVSDAHHLPIRNETIDTIINIAVLEHTRHPWQVVKEFYRALKPGCMAVIAVPFLQPEHNMPFDFFRFTVNGISELVKYAGFEIVEIQTLYNFPRTFAWLSMENLKTRPRLVRYMLLPVLSLLSRLGRDEREQDSAVYRGVYIIAKKPEA